MPKYTKPFSLKLTEENDKYIRDLAEKKSRKVTDQINYMIQNHRNQEFELKIKLETILKND